ncbi:hypothetical protein FACHB389_18640 [Nostoc calcicola FACHB-389]|nr:hypothetical protein FACHB389_18640 [Nostoc calcicola FACHB-389]
MYIRYFDEMEIGNLMSGERLIVVANYVRCSDLYAKFMNCPGQKNRVYPIVCLSFDPLFETTAEAFT